MPGWKTWTALEEVTAANMNSFVRDQTIQVFTNASARSAAITAPTRGLVSLLTDSGAMEIYYGAVTGWARPWNQPWGIMGTGEITSDVFVNAGTFDVTGCTTTFTALTGRRYRITARTIMDNNHGAAQGIDARILIGATTIQVIPDFLNGNPTLGDARPMGLDWVGTIASGSVTAKLQGTFTAGLSNNFRAGPTQPSFIVVEDIGPSTVAPAS